MGRRLFFSFGHVQYHSDRPTSAPPPAPVKTGNPTISSPTLNVGDTATAVHGTYTGIITGYSRQWYRGASPIALATALTYTYVSADLGLNITYQESAYNGGGSSATGASNALGPIVNAGGGTLSAPALGYPSPKAGNPTSIIASLGIDWQSGVGEAIKLAYSSSVAMTSPTILTHTLTDADALAGAVTIGIPTLGGVTYFQGYGNSGGVDSANKSNIVAWGNASAPSITSSLTQTGNDASPMAFAVVTDHVANLTIGGTDAALIQVVGTPGTSATVELLSNANTNYATKSSYTFTLTPTDLSGNVGTPQSCTFNVTTTTVQLTPVNGSGKNSNLNVSGSPPLTFTGFDANNDNCARTNLQQTANKAQFEVTIVSGGATGFMVVGIDDGTANLAGNIAPGWDNSTGLAVVMHASGVAVYWNNQANNVLFAAGPNATADGDVFTIVYDKVNNLMECWRTRSGSTVQLGSAASVASLSAQYAFGGSLNIACSGRLNFGATPYTKTPGSGVASHWGP